LSLQLLSLAHLDNPTIPIVLPIVETTLGRNINVSSAVVLPISNGTVPFTPVKPAIKWHQDMHLGHVEDKAMTMEFVVITTLMDTKMETSRESVEKHVIGS
jgi:hypothetical protein